MRGRKMMRRGVRRRKKAGKRRCVHMDGSSGGGSGSSVETLWMMNLKVEYYFVIVK